MSVRECNEKGGEVNARTRILLYARSAWGTSYKAANACRVLLQGHESLAKAGRTTSQLHRSSNVRPSPSSQNSPSPFAAPVWYNVCDMCECVTEQSRAGT